MKKLTVRDWGRYIGCRVYNTSDNIIGVLCGLSIDNNGENILVNFYGEIDWMDSDFFKPILRPIEDMTEEENDRYSILASDNPFSCLSVARMVDYMDSIGIDHRGYIPAGLAVDAKEVNNG